MLRRALSHALLPKNHGTQTLMEVAAAAFSSSPSAPSSSSAASAAPVEAAIRAKLHAAFAAHGDFVVEVVNESHKHNVPKGSESHFNVLVVSDAFEGKKLIERHRMVNTALKEELATSVHALSIAARTMAQHVQDPAMKPTPNCMGGSKH